MKPRNKPADPYTALGVPKDADAETIRQAHRKAAKKHHPDANGNAANFREINEAYMILRDPGKRARYDATGETEQKDTALNDLIQLFVAAAEIAEPGESPLELLARRLRNDGKQTLAAKEDLLQRAVKLRRRAAKVTRKSAGPNILAIALINHADGLERKASSAQDELDRLSKMQAILKEYDFERDEPFDAYKFTFTKWSQ